MARLLLCLVLCAALGCGSEPPATASARAAAEAPTGSEFDPAACGTVTGLVSWTGPVPEVPPVVRAAPRADGTGFDLLPVALARAPRIDRASRGFAGVVVALRGISPARAKPWDHPPVSVDLRDQQIIVTQGARAGRAGFVRRGELVRFASAEPDFRSLRLRGTAFGAIPFPPGSEPVVRAFDAPGPVELSSAAGHFWQSADLFVCDHPYYTVTDAEGRFQFAQVPAGEYVLAAWHPNWIVTRAERNPESTLVSRYYYAEPLEESRPVLVAPGKASMATVAFPK